MKNQDGDTLSDYIINLAVGIPVSFYVILLSFLLVGGLVIFYCNGIKKKRKYFYRLLTFSYLILLYGSTVFFREVTRLRHYEPTPFWSYGKFNYHYSEIIMNVVVFIPIGFFIKASYKWLSWWNILICGLIISIGIECLQFFLKRGVAEIDDLFHNSLGCLIGYLLFCLIRRMCNKSIKVKKWCKTNSIYN